MSDFVTLKSHVKVVKGKPPARIPYSGKEALPYLNPEYLRGNGGSVLAKSGSDSIAAAVGDTVVLWDGSNAGEFFRAKPGIVASTMALLACDDTFDPSYFYHAAKHWEWFLKGKTNGTGIPHVDREVLEGLSLFRPPGLSQRVIARILDTLDTQIEKTQALIAKLEQVKEGLLHDLLTRGVDENGELRPSAEEAPELYKASALGRIPKGWEASSTTAYLRDQDGIKPGPFGSSLKKESYTRTGFKVYGQEQVIAGDQSIGDYFISAAKFAELQDFEVREGDVLISLVGTVGRVLVLKSGYLPGLINPRLMRLRPNPSAASSEFLRLILMSSGFTRQIEALAGGGTMPVINKSIVQRVVVPYVPLAEQVRIVAVEATTVRQLSDERAYCLKLQTEKSGLMDDLLTGRVRVTPLLDPQEAPATV